MHGGAQWPGGVFDPFTQNLFIPVNQIPWKIRLFISSDEIYPKNFNIEYNLYEEQCSSCHGDKRNGFYRTHKEKEIEELTIWLRENEDNLNKFNVKIIKKKIYHRKFVNCKIDGNYKECLNILLNSGLNLLNFKNLIISFFIPN